MLNVVDEDADTVAAMELVDNTNTEPSAAYIMVDSQEGAPND